MEKNKTGKYLKYAFGEIILVVIGILIALSINNLNQERKANIFENKLIENLLPFVQSNTFHLKNSIKGAHRNIESAKFVLKHLENNRPYHDSLDSRFSNAISWNQANIKNSAYETLKTHGMHTIKNDSLRIKLGIYDRGYFETINARQEDYYFSTIAPILTELFKSILPARKMKPIDYEELKKSKEFTTILRTCIAYRKEQIFWYSKWLEELEELENIIYIELKENQK